jgi:hypothetical protein
MLMLVLMLLRVCAFLQWVLGHRFRAWRDWACGLARRRRTLRQVGGRLAHHTVARAFAVRCTPPNASRLF